MELEPYIERIQGRGGKVVFIRYVTSGVGNAIEERDYPRALYWDRFAQATKATCVYFADVETLRGFDCPDASHLDYKDVPRVARALCEELERRGILKAGR